MRDKKPAFEPDDDEVADAGGEIQDPILQAIPAGPNAEPPREELLKRDHKAGREAGAGSPPAGRSTFEEATRRGPLGWLQLLGPGLITGASDDDPSGIGTYAQVGSQFGYSVLWTAVFTFPLMAAVQELCARIALQTGVGLGTALRRKFPTWLIGICIAALFVANTINVGADLGAVAAGGSLLTKGALHQVWLVAPVAALVLGLQLFVTYSVIFKVFKWLTVTLFAYVITGLLIHPDVRQVALASVVPHLELSKGFIAALVAIFGTTISPYLFFWQATSEVNEMRAAGKVTEAERRGVTRSELKAARTDIVIGMLFSNLVMYFIILTSAAVFVLFALGMIGTGLLAIPILTGSAAYAVKEFVGLKGGLSDKPWYRPTFYAIMAISTIAGISLNLLGIDPIRALFITAVINGLVAPPLLVLIVMLGSDRTIMKERTSGVVSRSLTWITTAVMAVAAVALLVTFLVP